MQNHRLQRRESPPTTTKPPSTTTKQPLPPPLSVSIPSDPDPPTKPQPKIHSKESAHSPLRSDSLARSDDPDENPFASSTPSSKNPTTTTVDGGGADGATAGAIVPVEKYYSPLTSPLPVTPPKDSAASENFPLPLSSHHHIISFNRSEEAAPPQTGVAYDGGERKGRVGFVSPPRKASMVNKLGLGFRVLEIAFCLVSFSVMAADRTQGWSGDSFDRYKEYRFCLAVNILGFVYAGFQAYDLVYHMTTGKHVISHHYRYQFDFIMDQIIAYLLISASSASASRVDDWQANWGKDEFTEKASASISMAFLAFITFAMSSLISGYNLCTRDLS